MAFGNSNDAPLLSVPPLSPHLCYYGGPEGIGEMPDKRFDRRLDLDRMREGHEGSLERLRLAMEAAREEFERAVARGIDPLKAALKYRERFGDWPEPKFRKKRRPRGFEGGEPVPVLPRPKPKPLMDGAEAPME